MMSSMPKGLTASTGMDALTHAIEGYTTKAAWGDDRYVPSESHRDHFKSCAADASVANTKEERRMTNTGLRKARFKKEKCREGMALGDGHCRYLGFSNVGSRYRTFHGTYPGCCL